MKKEGFFASIEVIDDGIYRGNSALILEVCGNTVCGKGMSDICDDVCNNTVNEYIMTCYDVLHTTGAKYIVEDLDE